MHRKKIQNYIINLDACLGEGAFGQVYKGVDDRNKQDIAIKVLVKKKIDCEESIQDTYITEMKIMKKLKSPNIVEFIDVMETENHYYIVQEYCNGGDLRKRMSNSKKFAQKEVIMYLKDILRGFIVLLSYGVVHRDVKPENILIHNNKMKIADFGFAKVVLSPSQLNKTLVGTPLYMSPQLLKPQKYTSKCDIWAIGVMAYEMIVGKLPWVGNIQSELLININKQQLKFGDQVKISEELKEFISGCLRIEEADRYSWNDVYTHKIFQNNFKQDIEKLDLEDRKFKQGINGLRILIHSNDIDLQKIFQSLELGSQTILTKEIFKKIIKSIDPTGKTTDMFEVIIQKLSEDSDNCITLNLFKQLLKESCIQIKSLHRRKNDDKCTSRVKPIVRKLRARMKQSGIESEQLFVSYAKSKNSSLNLQKFQKLLLKVDKSLSKEDVKWCFEAFDIDKDGQISFSNFQASIEQLGA